MKTLFTVVITLLVTYGGYRAYQIYQDDRQLVSTLAGKLDKAEQKLGQVESTLEKKRVAEAQAKLNRISALKADIERQERLISELDRKISALDVGRTNSVADQLIDELRYQQSRVSVLEEQLREYKSGIAREDSDLKSIRTQGSAQKRAVLRSYQDQINRQQDALRTLREKLR
ncbi:MAG: hypothetical protein HY074_09800, partial [Deltaproteobacteria bacterium]|nr:hypothetical protein [Deltaproteobacteria bacterium]